MKTWQQTLRSGASGGRLQVVLFCDPQELPPHLITRGGVSGVIRIDEYIRPPEAQEGDLAGVRGQVLGFVINDPDAPVQVFPEQFQDLCDAGLPDNWQPVELEPTEVWQRTTQPVS
jgi:hypothetical protein